MKIGCEDYEESHVHKSMEEVKFFRIDRYGKGEFSEIRNSVEGY
jgi:hypothetical protein